MVQLPFLKKKEQHAGKAFAPTDRVRELANKGFSEPEMIDVLRKEGYTPEAIDTALTQTVKTNITASPPQSQPMQQYPMSQYEPQQQEQLPTLEELTPKVQMPQIPEQPLPQEYYQQQYPTEDYIDYIVQARVSEVNEKLNEFNIRHQEMEKRMNAIAENLTQLLQTRSGENQQILSRIDSFTDTMNDVNIRMGSLEKVFKETLPALIESVRMLSDLVQRVKREG